MAVVVRQVNDLRAAAQLYGRHADCPRRSRCLSGLSLSCRKTRHAATGPTP
jgi:hypothetical protein